MNTAYKNIEGGPEIILELQKLIIFEVLKEGYGQGFTYSLLDTTNFSLKLLNRATSRFHGLKNPVF